MTDCDHDSSSWAFDSDKVKNDKVKKDTKKTPHKNCQ